VNPEISVLPVSQALVYQMEQGLTSFQFWSQAQAIVANTRYKTLEADMEEE